jgi:Zn ribbon nucleic-acid-binding protein
VAFKRKIPNSDRPCCPKCQTGMIVIDGFGRELEAKTFECLQCGHVGKLNASRAEASEQPMDRTRPRRRTEVAVGAHAK